MQKFESDVIIENLIKGKRLFLGINAKENNSSNKKVKSCDKMTKESLQQYYYDNKTQD